MDVATTTPQAFGNGTIQTCRRGGKRGDAGGGSGSILLVALSRPERRNAFDDDTYVDLTNLLRCATKDPSVQAVVLTGTGTFFSSGADLKANSYAPEVDGRRTLFKPVGQFMIEIVRFPKILAAAVQGPAIGIAFTLLMHCDLVHCSTNATFWAPFTRLALVPELGSSVTFVNSMGLSKANELLLLGKQLNAQQAYEWNICSKIVHNCDTSGNPFHENSLASQMCRSIEKDLLALPNGDKTVDYFVSAVKGKRSSYMQQVVMEELRKLDERFDSGQVQEAARKLKIGSGARRRKTPSQQQQQPRSKL